MSGYYQSHKQQANARVQRMQQEGEMHRLAKQGSPGSGFFLFNAVKKLLGRQKETGSKGRERNLLDAPRRRRYAD